MSLRDKLKARGYAREVSAGTVWRGPEVDGITQSLLSRFLVCRERFRVYVVDGLRPADRWNHRIGYGNMWHTCEEAHAAEQNCESTWEQRLTDYCQQQCRLYPMQREEIAKWYDVCRVQFLIYVDYWSLHPEVIARTPLLSEQVFDVPYKLPSGRVVRLRGKWDSVDLVQNGGTPDVAHSGEKGVWLQENKTKGEVDEPQLLRQLTFDLQTMFYLVALGTPKPGHSGAGRDVEGWPYGVDIKGVRYNVVRRPLSGGKGTIVQGKGTQGSKCSTCKGSGRSKVSVSACQKCGGSGRLNAKPAETKEEYYARLAEYITDEPHTYFMRWSVLVTPGDVDKFRRQFLDPCLEQLCDWWEWITTKDQCKGDPNRAQRSVYGTSLHYRMPYGVYNPLLEGDVGDLDNYLDTGDARGLHRVENLFPELS